MASLLLRYLLFQNAQIAGLRVGDLCSDMLSISPSNAHILSDFLPTKETLPNMYRSLLLLINVISLLLLYMFLFIPVCCSIYFYCDTIDDDDIITTLILIYRAVIWQACIIFLIVFLSFFLRDESVTLAHLTPFIYHLSSISLKKKF